MTMRQVLPANTFVRRLIPTVAAATLTFACTPEGEEKDPNASTNGTPNNTSQNNTAANSTTTPNNTTPNSTTPNNTTPNNTTTNNTANNTTPVNNTTPANSGTGAEITLDGTITAAEIQAICQAFSECEPEYFMESYTGVDDCAMKMAAYMEENLMYYEAMGAECIAAVTGQQECVLAAMRCTDGTWTAPYEEYDACYMQFEAAFGMHCVME